MGNSKMVQLSALEIDLLVNKSMDSIGSAKSFMSHINQKQEVQEFNDRMDAVKIQLEESLDSMQKVMNWARALQE